MPIRSAGRDSQGFRRQYALRGCLYGRGFSLIELMIVIVVALILTALLLPALNNVRENVNTVICASNMRQINLALRLYANDHNSVLPSSVMLDQNGTWKPQELMAAHHGIDQSSWDGIGLLFSLGYCRDAKCFYCPSHFGEHDFDRYKSDWDQPGIDPIYTNYHFAGARRWISKHRRFINRRSSEKILVTDGLRTISDINHDRGINAGYADGSVRWRGDVQKIHPLLPEDDSHIAAGPFSRIWDELQGGGF